MSIYDSDKLARMQVVSTTHSWFRRKRITAEERAAICAAYSGGYTEPKLGTRIGYFIFGSFIASAAFGIFSLLYFAGGGFSPSSIACGLVFYGLCCYAAAEIHVRSALTYRSGITHAFLCFGAVSALVGAGIFIDDPQGNKMWVSFLLACCCLALIGYRFRSGLFLLASLICLLLALVFCGFQLGAVGKSLAPFACMVLSAGCYVLAQKQGLPAAKEIPQRVFHLLEYASLFLLYLSGNYFVVRNLSEGITNESVDAGADIPFASLFYAFTVLLPFVYIILGLLRKNRTLLVSGLITILGSIATIRYYHSFLRADVALTASGSILILFAAWALRYLRSPRAGLTSVKSQGEDDEESTGAVSSIGKLVISQVVSGNMPDSTDSDSVSFGGGSGGGGGAGGDF
jgi:hypothetical protein